MINSFFITPDPADTTITGIIGQKYMKKINCNNICFIELSRLPIVVR